VKSPADLKIKLFADGADKAQIEKASANPLIEGFTTNPTLMRAAGVRNYEAFARELLREVRDKPISFEVFADEFDEMERQARKIAGWAENVYVKIPISNTRGESAMPLAGRLARSGVKINVTAVLTLDQVREAAAAVGGGAPAVISVFAGRIADTGIDPVPLMADALALLVPHPNVDLLWASPRELLNIFQADAIGCHIITATEGVLSKLPSIGRDLREFSLETVAMFHTDAVRSGFTL
jgi:transaldolase